MRIFIANNSQTGFNILNNTIECFSRTSISTVAINLQGNNVRSTLTRPSRTLFVSENKIYNCQYAIRSNSNTGFNYENNFIALPTYNTPTYFNPANPRVGIETANEFPLIRHNYITIADRHLFNLLSSDYTSGYANTSNLQSKLIGIHFIQQNNPRYFPWSKAIISCDSIELMNWGMAYSGVNNVDITDCGMIDNQTHIALYNNGSIGDQGGVLVGGTFAKTTNENRVLESLMPIGTASNHFGYYNNNINTPTQAYYYRMGADASIDFTQNLSTYLGGGISNLIQHFNNTYSTSSPTYCQTPPFIAARMANPKVAELEAFAQRVPPSTTDTLEYGQYLWQKQASYQQLKSDTALLDSSTILKLYYASMDSYKEKLDFWQKLREEELTDAGKQLAEAENLQKQVDNQHEKNMQLLTDIELKYLRPIVPINPTDSLEIIEDSLPQSVEELLHKIASQCYVEGGASVFYARAIWEGIHKQTSFEFQDRCLERYGSYKTDPENTSMQTKSEHSFIFELFPNPSMRNQTVNIVSSENGTLSVVDALGRKITEQKLQAGVNILSLTEAKGIYHILFTSDSGTVVKSKLVLYE